MPESEVVVLVWKPLDAPLGDLGHRTLAYYHEGLCDWYSGINPIRSKITHWQPLPTAPKETNVSPRLYTHEQVLAFGEKAFKAGGEFVNECFCGECDYCIEAKDKSPDFNTWVNQNNLIN